MSTILNQQLNTLGPEMDFDETFLSEADFLEQDQRTSREAVDSDPLVTPRYVTISPEQLSAEGASLNDFRWMKKAKKRARKRAGIRSPDPPRLRLIGEVSFEDDNPGANNDAGKLPDRGNHDGNEPRNRDLSSGRRGTGDEPQAQSGAEDRRERKSVASGQGTSSTTPPAVHLRVSTLERVNQGVTMSHSSRLR